MGPPTPRRRVAASCLWLRYAKGDEVERARRVHADFVKTYADQVGTPPRVPLLRFDGHRFLDVTDRAIDVP
jgi:hypothetical protein